MLFLFLFFFVFNWFLWRLFGLYFHTICIKLNCRLIWIFGRIFFIKTFFLSCHFYFISIKGSNIFIWLPITMISFGSCIENLFQIIWILWLLFWFGQLFHFLLVIPKLLFFFLLLFHNLINIINFYLIFWFCFICFIFIHNWLLRFWFYLLCGFLFLVILFFWIVDDFNECLYWLSLLLVGFGLCLLSFFNFDMVAIFAFKIGSLGIDVCDFIAFLTFFNITNIDVVFCGWIIVIIVWFVYFWYFIFIV